MTSFNFSITSPAYISSLFRERHITNFTEAANFIRSLPYSRNSSRTEPGIAIKENAGTCSTKHAALVLLAAENNIPGVQQVIGIYKMNRTNTPRIGDTLERHGLVYVPEAHSYLRIHGELFDCTGLSADNNSFIADLMEEINIEPEQVGDFKISYHKEFLHKWMIAEKLPVSFDELWAIREECIKQLSVNN